MLYSIQVAFGLVSARYIWASCYISLGTLVLLLHGTFDVYFVQHMTSFCCRFLPFICSSVAFGYHCCFLDLLALSFLCFCQVVCLVVKRCALIGFVDDCFYRMVVKRCFDVFFPSSGSTLSCGCFLLDKHLFNDYVFSRCVSDISS